MSTANVGSITIIEKHYKTRFNNKQATKTKIR